MAEPMTDGQFTCETCKFCGTSAAMPPCNSCPRSMQDKWEPRPKTPWPVGPFKVDRMDKDELAQVLYSWDEPLCSGCDNDEADAIKLALNMLPECVAWMKEHAFNYPNILGRYHHPAQIAQRDALLAKIDAAGFKMPEDSNKQVNP